MTIKNKLLAAALMRVFLAAPAAAANAQPWGPLTVFEDNNARGGSNGDAAIAGSSQARNVMHWTGTPAGPTRMETTYLFNTTKAQEASPSWKSKGRVNSPTNNRADVASTFTADKELRTDGFGVRFSVRQCVPKPTFTPVPCSNSAIVTQSY
jgi:hypothetical protein